MSSKPPGIRTLDVTHIIREHNGEWDDPIAGLCGESTSTANYLSVRELYGLDLSHPDDIIINEEELNFYKSNMCPECENHPDLPLMYLGGV